jgi:hypothetical protein
MWKAYGVLVAVETRKDSGLEGLIGEWFKRVAASAPCKLLSRKVRFSRSLVVSRVKVLGHS